MQDRISHADVIDWWPSAAQLAREIGLDPQTVQKWRVRARIPADYWPAVIKAGKARKIRITAAQLMDMQS